MEQLQEMDNREKILECALSLFYQKGYDAVGVQEIVTLAGITKPTMYYYFKSKYGLLEALLQERCCKINEQLREAAYYNGDLVHTLEQYAKTMFTIAESDIRFYYLILSLFYSARENETYKAISPYMKEQFAIIRGIFEHAAGYLGNMNGRQEQFAVGFSGILNNYILVYFEREHAAGRFVNDRAIYSLVHQFMYGIVV
ncbi:TetR/AcrR family transcriptional regulator [Anaerosporobacter sp.]|uniref:TetR/AcrR family transcriptional regulator n=1 Tax=Anaerosporobacter sp. TaxID=1872529 RepID=UPI00286F7E50|nr:TetR/AcrR family transcriptional regulator [Anaerosporobacter sp.]